MVDAFDRPDSLDTDHLLRAKAHNRKLFVE
jgi:hypothetical protein